MSSVDVVVPCYRYGHFLKECVGSVLSESAIAVRVLIIDDASPDNTAEIARALASDDSRVTFLLHKENKGHIATYNEGIEWAASRYMLILSADDYLLPGALERSVRFMDTHPEVGFTFGNFIALSNEGVRSEVQVLPAARGNVSSRILRGIEFIELCSLRNIVSAPTAVVRTALQKQHGGYRTELPHSGDLEMWLRLAAHSSVGFIESYQAIYRRHVGNMSLDYTATSWLPDLQQRKAAIDCFFATESHAIPNAEVLKRRMIWLLGCQAIRYGSEAFNKHRMEVSSHLSEFALSVCPEVKWSLPSAKLAIKRSLGQRRWHSLQSVCAMARRMGRLSK